MSRPEFENQTLISAVTSKTITSVTVSNTFSLAHLAYDVTKIYSPVGTVSRVMGFEAYYPPTGSAAGTEKNIIVSLLEFMPDNVTAKAVLEQVAVSSNDNLDCKIEYGEPKNVRSAPSGYFPSDLAAFQNQLKGMIFDDQKPLQIAFYNNTGVAITSSRSFTIFVEREVIKR